MRLNQLSYLIDQSVHRDVTSLLRDLGITCAAVSELGLSRALDKEILGRAIALERVVLTHDLDLDRWPSRRKPRSEW